MHPFAEDMDTRESYQHISCGYVEKIFLITTVFLGWLGGAVPLQITINDRVKGRLRQQTVVTAAVRRRASTMGEGADRRRWRMQGSGRRENNEQTRGHLCRRSMRRLFFRAVGSEPRTSWRGALHRNQRHFWYFWCQKYTINICPLPASVRR